MEVISLVERLKKAADNKMLLELIQRETKVALFSQLVQALCAMMGDGLHSERESLEMARAVIAKVERYALAGA